jgi:hypothetical protein
LPLQILVHSLPSFLLVEGGKKLQPFTTFSPVNHSKSSLERLVTQPPATPALAFISNLEPGIDMPI